MKAGRPPCCKKVGENVGCIGPEVRAKIFADIGLREFLKVFGELRLGIAPGEICVGLGESQLGQLVHRFGAGESFRQKQHVGMAALDVGDQPLPEIERLGVGIVDAEDADALLDPVKNDAAQFFPELLAFSVSKSRG